MKNTLYLLIFIIVLSSCKSKRSTVNTSKKLTNTQIRNNKKTVIAVENTTSKPPSKRFSSKKNFNKKSSTKSVSDKIINNAFSFEGTKYKYGGTTNKGMDCSGLIYTSFNLANITFPRTSFEQSKKGIRIAISKVKKGDLLFFKTSKKNRISHVGMVVKVSPKNIEFIHTSSSKGVVVSSLNETYWSKAFAIAKRVL